MAALYEGYTLCGLVPAQNLTSSGVHGIKSERDDDHVLITDSARSVTLYKVSDQKPLCSWTVKQGRSLTCPVVYNSITKEYVAVSDNKVIQIWKEDDISLDKAFKATLSSDVWQVHSTQGAEPVVLFQRGAVRFLDSILAAPQQTVEDVLAHEEDLRWSTHLVADSQHCVIFTTEQKGDHFLYLQRLNPNSLQKYRLEREELGLCPLSFSVALREKHICLLYLYPNGRVYQSVVPLRAVGSDDGSQTLTLPRTLLLSLSVGEGHLEAASALILDEAHVAVVGVPHPSAGAGKDFLCIWNIHFQTLQAGKEMAGKIYGQLWRFSNKLFIPHGKSLSVIRYECPKSCLAIAVGKMRQARIEECKGPSSVPSWSNVLHGEKVEPPRTADARKTRMSRRTQSAPSLSIEQILELIKTEPVEKVQQEVGAFISSSNTTDLQLVAGRLASALVSRSLADLTFYTGGLLSQLVQSRNLCYSICPDLLLLALEKRDYFLCQLCLQFFPDIPEAITCACLKAFISMTDSDANILNLDPASVSFMDMLITKDNAQDGSQNGCSYTSVKNDSLEIMDGAVPKENTQTPLEETCPVSLNKAVLLNEILQASYSENCLLPHLKDLSSQHALVFLQYLQFLYLKYSQDAFPQRKELRSPTLNQVMDWVCMVLDTHFTVLVMTPEAKGLLFKLHTFVKSQVKLFSELGKIGSSLQEINKMKAKKEIGQYSIEIIELY
ncbi:nucleolar protein 11-like [Periophthalmus magnuspinnatus]|uniref:nucleolar protein 11-like n=1 Tax=Periophthalmus magnuspinnatus TaxID=409849 RepID=UPI00145B78E7|nr:nucleolar protein 11-like [Periophthalmus magnuspinnatus]